MTDISAKRQKKNIVHRLPAPAAAARFAVLFLLCWFFVAAANAGGHEPLYPFLAPADGIDDDDLFGFRDAAGQVVIPPKFSAYSLGHVRRFDAIVAVQEIGADGRIGRSYHLTRSGREVGEHDMHIFDNTFDCESEGFIRFRRHETGKVGLFNENGDIAIPADYDEMSKVTNGMVAAQQGSRKIFHGEHYSRVGGQGMLLDTQNRVLVTPFENKWLHTLDLTDLTIGMAPDPAPERVNFRGVDGRYYAFADLEKSFRLWLEAALPKDFDRDALTRILFDRVKFGDKRGERLMEKHRFAARYTALVRDQLAAIRHPHADYFITQEDYFRFDDFPELERYVDNCGNPSAYHPLMALIIQRKPNRKPAQAHFYFLRTEQGYRLVEAHL
jgi:hypothetical protein